MTAHERLKRDFEEFRIAMMRELVGKGMVNPKDSRLDRIEARLEEIEKQLKSGNREIRFKNGLIIEDHGQPENPLRGNHPENIITPTENL